MLLAEHPQFFLPVDPPDFPSLSLSLSFTLSGRQRPINARGIHRNVYRAMRIRGIHRRIYIGIMRTIINIDNIRGSGGGNRASRREFVRLRPIA